MIRTWASLRIITLLITTLRLFLHRYLPSKFLALYLSICLFEDSANKSGAKWSEQTGSETVLQPKRTPLSGR